MGFPPPPALYLFFPQDFSSHSPFSRCSCSLFLWPDRCFFVCVEKLPCTLCDWGCLWNKIAMEIKEEKKMENFPHPVSRPLGPHFLVHSRERELFSWGFKWPHVWLVPLHAAPWSELALGLEQEERGPGEDKRGEGRDSSHPLVSGPSSLFSGLKYFSRPHLKLLHLHWCRFLDCGGSAVRHYLI